jgi:hypothetical protein
LIPAFRAFNFLREVLFHRFAIPHPSGERSNVLITLLPEDLDGAFRDVMVMVSSAGCEPVRMIAA